MAINPLPFMHLSSAQLDMSLPGFFEFIRQFLAVAQDLLADRVVGFKEPPLTNVLTNCDQLGGAFAGSPWRWMTEQDEGDHAEGP